MVGRPGLGGGGRITNPSHGQDSHLSEVRLPVLMLDLATESSSEGTSAKLAPEYSETSFKIKHPEVGTASLKVLQI